MNREVYVKTFSQKPVDLCKEFRSVLNFRASFLEYSNLPVSVALQGGGNMESKGSLQRRGQMSALGTLLEFRNDPDYSFRGISRYTGDFKAKKTSIASQNY